MFAILVKVRDSKQPFQTDPITNRTDHFAVTTSLIKIVWVKHLALTFTKKMKKSPFVLTFS